MTTTADQPVLTEATENALTFPAEHYGCPAWCTVNGTPGGHDGADGKPDSPTFEGYLHIGENGIMYGPGDQGGGFPTYITADLTQDGDGAPQVVFVNSVHQDLGDEWTLSLDEAEDLARAILQQTRAARPRPESRRAAGPASTPRPRRALQAVTPWLMPWRSARTIRALRADMRLLIRTLAANVTPPAA